MQYTPHNQKHDTPQHPLSPHFFSIYPPLPLKTATTHYPYNNCSSLHIGEGVRRRFNDSERKKKAIHRGCEGKNRDEHGGSQKVAILEDQAWVCSFCDYCFGAFRAGREESLRRLLPCRWNWKEMLEKSTFHDAIEQQRNFSPRATHCLVDGDKEVLLEEETGIEGREAGRAGLCCCCASDFSCCL